MAAGKPTIGGKLASAVAFGGLGLGLMLVADLAPPGTIAAYAKRDLILKDQGGAGRPCSAPRRGERVAIWPLPTLSGERRVEIVPKWGCAGLLRDFSAKERKPLDRVEPTTRYRFAFVPGTLATYSGVSMRREPRYDETDKNVIATLNALSDIQPIGLVKDDENDELWLEVTRNGEVGYIKYKLLVPEAEEPALRFSAPRP